MPKLRIKVKPKSSLSGLEEQPDGSWIARVRSVPADGKANQELIEVIAQHFSISKSRVTFHSGKTSRIKTIVIDDED